MSNPAITPLVRSPDTTVTRRFLRRVAANPDAVALRRRSGDDGWESWTWTDYADRACRVAVGLDGLGVRPGDRVVLMMRNAPAFHAVDMGVLLSGATPVSIYNSSPPEQIAYLVDHCGAEVVVVDDPELLGRVQAAGPHLRRLRHVVMADPGGDAPAGTVGWEHLVGAAPVDLEAAVARSRSDDLVTVIYTSGTTGPPKGVMITHENTCFVLDSMRQLDPDRDMTGFRLVSYLPMAHIAERTVSHYEAIEFGFEVTTCPEPTALLSYLTAVHPQIVFGVPRVWEKVHAGVTALAKAGPDGGDSMFAAVDVGLAAARARLEGRTLAPDDQAAFDAAAPTLELVRALIGLDAVEIAVSGAAPLPRPVIDFLLGLGLPFNEVYGMSENTGPMTWSTVDDFKPGAVGHALPGTEVRVAADGEVLCRGGHVFAGYLDDPVWTAETIDADGWLHTGDIGELDADGYLRIVDRKKELIITAGKNISPANVEMLLRALPLVGQACVIGEGRPYLTAVVVLDPDVVPVRAAGQGIDHTDLAVLARHPAVVAEVTRSVDAEVNPHLSRTEQIKRCAVLGEEWLPDTDLLTPTSKLKRRGVAARYATAIEEMYAGDDTTP